MANIIRKGRKGENNKRNLLFNKKLIGKKKKKQIPVNPSDNNSQNSKSNQQTTKCKSLLMKL
jgi:hypothetical protein